jgi:hypothetical protein
VMENLETSCPARPLEAQASACNSHRASDTRGGLSAPVGRLEVAGAIRFATLREARTGSFPEQFTQ